MTKDADRPIWMRAIGRAAVVMLVLIVGFEAMRLFGRADQLSRGEALVIAVSGGVVYSIIWAVTAAMTAKMLRKIEDAAKDQKK
ncbi:MAG: hypothetical protein ACKVS5_05055 [Parvularculaceae bacterium]